MHIVFFDNFEWRERFYPLSLTRPIADLRVGILTISEKWRTWLGSDYSYLTEAYLRPIYPLETIHDDYCIIRGNVLPDERLCEVIHGLKLGEGIADALGPVALRVDADGLYNFMGRGLDGLRWSQAASEINQL